MSPNPVVAEGELPEGIPKATIEALAAFRYLLRRFLRYSEERAYRTGLTPQQYQLLLAVAGQPGRDWATIRDIADALQIQHHAAVGLVSRCERHGLVKRQQDDADRRQVCVTLTPAGQTAMQTIARENLGELKDLLLSLEMLFHDGPVTLRQAVSAANTISALSEDGLTPENEEKRSG